MKILLIGGTGTISMEVSRQLLAQGHTLYLINRGSNNCTLTGDLVELNSDINDEERIAKMIDNLEFDVVADFIAFEPKHLERDYRLFCGKTKQFIFISSASAYQKPPLDYFISEKTPLGNPYSEYAQNKIACEEYLSRLYNEENFPVTIIRPSHTYDKRSVPLGVLGNNGSYCVIKRMLEHKPVIIHGDGSSLWTLTYTSDFAKGFVGLVGNSSAIGETIQITSDEAVTWNRIYQIVADALGVPLNAIHVSSEFLDICSDYDYRASMIGDKSNTVVFNNAKLKQLVPGFHADISIEKGIKTAVDYVMSHPECQIEDPEFDHWCDKIVETMNIAIKTYKTLN